MTAPTSITANTTASPGDHGSGAPTVDGPPGPTRWAIPAVALGALATDLAMWTTGPGLAWTLAATAAATAVAIGARPRRPAAVALLVAVPVFAVWCSVRATPWLIAPDVVAINLCLILAAALGRRGSWFDQTLPRLVIRVISFAEDLVLAAPWLRPVVVRRPGEPATPRRDWKPVIGGLVVGVPLVVTLVVLLASADAVFASFFDVGLDGWVIARHAAFLIGGALAVAALLRKASATVDPPIDGPMVLSATAGNVVLAAVASVFALFAVSRVLALTGMAERIATTRGLTWAEYARSGFFQLLGVAAITLVVLLVVCGCCDRGARGQARLRRVLGLVIVVEILGIVIDAIHRLSGYERAYGLTMLRLFSTAFAVWIGVVFVIVAIALSTNALGRRWLIPAIVVAAFAGLLVVNTIDPEAVVAARNLSGPTKYGETDVRYLVDQLGDDALPVLDEHIDDLHVNDLASVLRRVCTSDRHDRQWFNPNSSRSEADRIIERWCR